jgi:hypothetical protein
VPLLYVVGGIVSVGLLIYLVLVDMVLVALGLV